MEFFRPFSSDYLMAMAEILCKIWIFLQLFLFQTLNAIGGNPDAKRLFEDLLSDYNKLVRPVESNNQTLDVAFKLKLSQLLDVHEKNQIMTTNVWLEHSWQDYKLQWNPAKYGGVRVIYVPSEMIWLPDIVLYNNADGNYQVTIMTKAKVFFNGTVIWNPPAIYKSMCQIDVEWFPFDAQKCEMKFGSWTYGGLEVDLKHKDSDKEICEWVAHPKSENDDEFTEEFKKREIHAEYCKGEKRPDINGEWTWKVDRGIDLSEYYPSVEWDILGVPGIRHRIVYPCCPAPFIDITYNLELRRKTLFYTVNLIFPSVGISFLTALVFYLPSDSGEKISLCISILISLTVFFLLLVEIIPSTSLVIPLIGKYLLFTMVLVTLSVVVTVMTLNVHYRSPTTHNMPSWIRKVFIDFLPKYLCMKRPKKGEDKKEEETVGGVQTADGVSPHLYSPLNTAVAADEMTKPTGKLSPRLDQFRRPIQPGEPNYFAPSSPANWKERMEGFHREHSPTKTAIDSVCYIADHLKNGEEDDEVKADWKFAAMVMDQLFLIIFTISTVLGTFVIILRAPTLMDSTPAIA